MASFCYNGECFNKIKYQGELIEMLKYEDTTISVLENLFIGREDGSYVRSKQDGGLIEKVNKNDITDTINDSLNFGNGSLCIAWGAGTTGIEFTSGNIAILNKDGNVIFNKNFSIAGINSSIFLKGKINSESISFYVYIGPDQGSHVLKQNGDYYKITDSTTDSIINSSNGGWLGQNKLIEYDEDNKKIIEYYFDEVDRKFSIIREKNVDFINIININEISKRGNDLVFKGTDGSLFDPTSIIIVDYDNLTIKKTIKLSNLRTNAGRFQLLGDEKIFLYNSLALQNEQWAIVDYDGNVIKNESSLSNNWTINDCLVLDNGNLFISQHGDSWTIINKNGDEVANGDYKTFGSSRQNLNTVAKWK